MLLELMLAKVRLHPLSVRRGLRVRRWRVTGTLHQMCVDEVEQLCVGLGRGGGAGRGHRVQSSVGAEPLRARAAMALSKGWIV